MMNVLCAYKYLSAISLAIPCLLRPVNFTLIFSHQVFLDNLFITSFSIFSFIILKGLIVPLMSQVQQLQVQLMVLA